jgi:hypothetical protein
MNRSANYLNTTQTQESYSKYMNNNEDFMMKRQRLTTPLKRTITTTTTTTNNNNNNSTYAKQNMVKKQQREMLQQRVNRELEIQQQQQQQQFEPVILPPPSSQEDNISSVEELNNTITQSNMIAALVNSTGTGCSKILESNNDSKTNWTSNLSRANSSSCTLELKIPKKKNSDDLVIVRVNTFRKGCPKKCSVETSMTLGYGFKILTNNWEFSEPDENQKDNFQTISFPITKVSKYITLVFSGSYDYANAHRIRSLEVLHQSDHPTANTTVANQNRSVTERKSPVQNYENNSSTVFTQNYTLDNNSENSDDSDITVEQDENGTDHPLHQQQTRVRFGTAVHTIPEFLETTVNSPLDASFDEPVVLNDFEEFGNSSSNNTGNNRKAIPKKKVLRKKIPVTKKTSSQNNGTSLFPNSFNPVVTSFASSESEENSPVAKSSDSNTESLFKPKVFDLSLSTPKVSQQKPSIVQSKQKTQQKQQPVTRITEKNQDRMKILTITPTSVVTEPLKKSISLNTTSKKQQLSSSTSSTSSEDSPPPKIYKINASPVTNGARSPVIDIDSEEEEMNIQSDETQTIRSSPKIIVETPTSPNRAKPNLPTTKPPVREKSYSSILDVNKKEHNFDTDLERLRRDKLELDEQRKQLLRDRHEYISRYSENTPVRTPLTTKHKEPSSLSKRSTPPSSNSSSTSINNGSSARTTPLSSKLTNKKRVTPYSPEKSLLATLTAKLKEQENLRRELESIQQSLAHNNDKDMLLEEEPNSIGTSSNTPTPNKKKILSEPLSSSSSGKWKRGTPSSSKKFSKLNDSSSSIEISSNPSTPAILNRSEQKNASLLLSDEGSDIEIEEDEFLRTIKKQSPSKVEKLQEQEVVFDEVIPSESPIQSDHDEIQSIDDIGSIVLPPKHADQFHFSPPLKVVTILDDFNNQDIYHSYTGRPEEYNTTNNDQTNNNIDEEEEEEEFERSRLKRERMQRLIEKQRLQQEEIEREKQELLEKERDLETMKYNLEQERINKEEALRQQLAEEQRIMEQRIYLEQQQIILEGQREQELKHLEQERLEIDRQLQLELVSQKQDQGRMGEMRKLIEQERFKLESVKQQRQYEQEKLLRLQEQELQELRYQRRQEEELLEQERHSINTLLEEKSQPIIIPLELPQQIEQYQQEHIPMEQLLEPRSIIEDFIESTAVVELQPLEVSADKIVVSSNNVAIPRLNLSDEALRSPRSDTDSIPEVTTPPPKVSTETQTPQSQTVLRFKSLLNQSKNSNSNEPFSPLNITATGELEVDTGISIIKDFLKTTESSTPAKPVEPIISSATKINNSIQKPKEITKDEDSLSLSDNSVSTLDSEDRSRIILQHWEENEPTQKPQEKEEQVTPRVKLSARDKVDLKIETPFSNASSKVVLLETQSTPVTKPKTIDYTQDTIDEKQDSTSASPVMSQASPSPYTPGTKIGEFVIEISADGRPVLARQTPSTPKTPSSVPEGYTANQIKTISKQNLWILNFMRKGSVFIKHHYAKKKGSSNPRTVKMDATCSNLILQKTSGLFKNPKKIPVKDIKWIVYGPHTSVMKTKLSGIQHPWRCFSIVLNNRSIDLEAHNDTDCDVWLLGIQQLVYKRIMQFNRPLYSKGKLCFMRTRMKILLNIRRSNSNKSVKDVIIGAIRKADETIDSIEMDPYKGKAFVTRTPATPSTPGTGYQSDSTFNKKAIPLHKRTKSSNQDLTARSKDGMTPVILQDGRKNTRFSASTVIPE